MKNASVVAECPRPRAGRSKREPTWQHRRRLDPSQPERGRDACRLRGLGGDVPVLRPLRRGAARRRRAPLLVLEFDALPGTDARVRRDLHRYRLPGARHVAEPGLRRAAGDGDRLALHQRLHLHLRQPRHRSCKDRGACGLFPAARGVLLRQLGRPLCEVAYEDGRADRGATAALEVPELLEYEPDEVAFEDQETSYCAVLDAYRRRSGSPT